MSLPLTATDPYADHQLTVVWRSEADTVEVTARECGGGPFGSYRNTTVQLLPEDARQMAAWLLAAAERVEQHVAAYPPSRIEGVR